MKKITKKSPFIPILCASVIIIACTLFFLTTPIKKITKNSNSSTPTSNNTCIKAGCSKQLCIDKSEAAEKGVSTCEWREVYKCFQQATCERQKDGKCGFTQSNEYQNCLRKNL